jgi:DNA polymerase I
VDKSLFIPEKTLYLIDGSSFAYRSFYAIRDLRNSKGQPTGAVFGFINSLKKIIKDFSPLYLGVCLDISRQTFRREKYSEYKITRPVVPDDFKIQMPWIRNFLESLRISISEKAGYEADDIIATLAKEFSKSGWSVVIFSFDKDILQVVKDRQVVLFNLNKEIVFDQNKVIEVMRVMPKQIPDFLGLTGDKSDNIPGVKGIGPKTAVALLKEFGSLENLFENIDKINKDSLKEKLLNSKPAAFLSKDLAVLDSSMNIDKDPEYFKLREPDYPRFLELARELEFKSVAKDFSRNSGRSSLKTRVQEFDINLKKKIEEKKEIVFYFSGSYFYVFIDNCSYKAKTEDIEEFLNRRDINKISYGIKSQISKLGKHGLSIELPFFDIKIAAFLLSSHRQDYSLSSLVWEYLARSEPDIDETQKAGFIQSIFYRLGPEIKREGLQDLFFNIEMPLIKVLAWMEACPVNLNLDFLKDTLSYLGQKKDKTEQAIFKDVNSEFNLNSPKQLSEVLFGSLGLTPCKKTKAGFSTNEEVLVKLKDQHPVVGKILEYRKLAKLISTYIIPLITLGEKNQGKVLPQFSQTGTATGRLVSFSPNFQNIPIGPLNGRNIRESVISGFKDGYIFSADYSQIELRVLAHICRDSNLIRAFNQDKDIHRFTASLLFEKPETQIDFSQREFAKRINFGIVYGMSSYGLAKELGLNQKEAGHFIEEYFKRYPGVKQYMDKTKDKVLKQGFVETLFGRKRYLKEASSPNRFLKEYALRQAVNAPIQGTAADIIKMAMVRVFREFQQNKIRSRLIMQIHDELVFDVPFREIEDVSKTVREVMEDIVSFKVSLKVNINYGKTWLEAGKS